jgi:tRNA(Ile)-lysidine synthase
MEAFLDYDKIKFPIKIRRWKKGDIFLPLRMDKKKKVSDFFIDSKVEEYKRYRIPIFADQEKIIWIGKYRIDNRAKVTPSTKKVLHLRITDL